MPSRSRTGPSMDKRARARATITDPCHPGVGSRAPCRTTTGGIDVTDGWNARPAPRPPASGQPRLAVVVRRAGRPVARPVRAGPAVVVPTAAASPRPDAGAGRRPRRAPPLAHPDPADLPGHRPAGGRPGRHPRLRLRGPRRRRGRRRHPARRTAQPAAGGRQPGARLAGRRRQEGAAERGHGPGHRGDRLRLRGLRRRLRDHQRPRRRGRRQRPCRSSFSDGSTAPRRAWSAATPSPTSR